MMVTNVTKIVYILDLTQAYLTKSDWTSDYFGDIGGFNAYFSAPGQDEELKLEKYYLTVDRNVCLEMSKRVSF